MLGMLYSFRNQKKKLFQLVVPVFALMCDRFLSTRSANYHNKGRVLIFRRATDKARKSVITH